MTSTNRRKVIPEKNNHNLSFFIWAALVASLIVVAGCTPLPPQPPTIKTINIGSRLDIPRINTNFNDSSPREFVFFLGGPTRSYQFTFTVSGWTHAENTLTVLSGSGQEQFSVHSDGNFTTPDITGNVVIFRYQINCTECDNFPQVVLDSVQLTMSTTPVLPSVEAGMADTLASMPVTSGKPVYLLYNNTEEATYFLSAFGLIGKKVFIGLDGSNKALISNRTTGFILGEDQAIDVMDNNTVLDPKFLTPGAELNTLLFTVPLAPGRGIAKFSLIASDTLDTRLLDFGKVAAAGGGFYIPDASPEGCVSGMYDALTGRPGEGISKGEPGIIFGVICGTNITGMRGDLFAYTNFRLKNGWAVKSVGRLFTTRGTWFISEQEAADESGRGNQQGFNLNEAPSPGSRTPFLSAHIWADRAPLFDERTYWVYVRVEIEGPPGTDPYGTSPCPAGLMSVPTTEGGQACVESITTSESAGGPAYECADSRDCDTSDVCAILIPGRQECVH